jgi:hypothetical protein
MLQKRAAKFQVNESKSVSTAHHSRPKPAILMMRKTFYLEASTRTQDLLDTQRALRAAEYGIGSTWHEEVGSSHCSDPEGWITQRFEELNRCDALIVLCGHTLKIPLQVPLLAGHALARGLQVIWIGSSVRVAGGHRNMAQFGTVEEFCESLTLKRAA